MTIDALADCQWHSLRYIIGLTLGPTFLSSSLYLGISALQRWYHTACFSPVGPKLFASIFIVGDFICLAFIGVGGSLAAIYADQPIGVDLMIAGLATQVFFTTIFCLVLFFLYRNTKKEMAIHPHRWYMLGEYIRLPVERNKKEKIDVELIQNIGSQLLPYPQRAFSFAPAGEWWN
jgi:hypothetical protein